MFSEECYQLALTMVPHIGDVQARALIHHFGSATALFQAPLHELERVEGIGPFRARQVREFKQFRKAENEWKFIQDQDVHMVFLNSPSYPKRLLHCADAPVLLFAKGHADLNARRMISIVGTRHATEYGKYVTAQLVKGLASLDATVVSGLALGIDACAHREALKAGLPTIGVVAHGIDTVYPAIHKTLVKEMLEQGGGLLTEFFHGTLPDRHNFPLRNRIVAGLCDALIVVETGIRGGSMITAALANDYHRDVLAIPGRVQDTGSAGCHELIKHNKAVLMTGVEDLVQLLGWDQQNAGAVVQRNLFVDLNEDEEAIVQLMRKQEVMHVDDITWQIPLSNSHVAATLLQLELKGVIHSLPGKMYRLA